MKLYGMPLSNYSNMIKHALLEKGVDFEMVPTRPSQEPAFLAKSPMGKVPMLETDAGCLTESDVILNYLEETFPEPALFPADAFERAKVRQLMKTLELYVEGPVHRLVGVLFDREISDFVKESTPDKARRGLEAFQRLANFTPWIAGSEFSAADIFAFYSFTLCKLLTDKVYGWDLLSEVPGLPEWYERMAQREITRQVLADMHQD